LPNQDYIYGLIVFVTVFPNQDYIYGLIVFVTVLPNQDYIVTKTIKP
jgi:uncharacterized membrane protein